MFQARKAREATEDVYGVFAGKNFDFWNLQCLNRIYKTED